MLGSEGFMWGFFGMWKNLEGQRFWREIRKRRNELNQKYFSFRSTRSIRYAYDTNFSLSFQPLLEWGMFRSSAWPGLCFMDSVDFPPAVENPPRCNAKAECRSPDAESKYLDTACWILHPRLPSLCLCLLISYH